jgi:hypothetical protein
MQRRQSMAHNRRQSGIRGRRRNDSQADEVGPPFRGEKGKVNSKIVPTYVPTVRRRIIEEEECSRGGKQQKPSNLHASYWPPCDGTSLLIWEEEQ